MQSQPQSFAPQPLPERTMEQAVAQAMTQMAQVANQGITPGTTTEPPPATDGGGQTSYQQNPQQNYQASAQQPPRQNTARPRGQRPNGKASAGDGAGADVESLWNFLKDIFLNKRPRPEITSDGNFVLSAKHIRQSVQWKRDPIRQLISYYRSTLITIGFFSVFINVLMLVPPIFMMQIYNRVLGSANTSTLVSMTAIAIFLMGFQSMLEAIRLKIMGRIGAYINFAMQDSVFESAFLNNLMRNRPVGSGAVRDMEQVRMFITSPLIFVIYDTPWAFMFLGILFYINTVMGIFALVGMVLVFILAVMTEVASKTPFRNSATYSNQASQFIETSLRNTDVLQAMGMMRSMQKKWRENYEPTVNLMTKAQDTVATLSTLSRSLRQLLQSLVLGLASYLVLTDQLSPGLIVACSIIVGKVLQPVDMAIGGWRSFSTARFAYLRLSTMLSQFPPNIDNELRLPRPKGIVAVEELVGSPPGATRPIIQGISAQFMPGTVTAVVGPSGAGKTTFAQFLCGVWRPMRGFVRIDGADINNLNPNDRPNFIGYVPQTVELFEGSVAENIARFQTPDMERVVAMAELANCHEIIMRLDKNYETDIGIDGVKLSAGQRQKIALARALYTDPAVIVMDEPNSNLDTAGEVALLNAITALKQAGRTVIFITHNTKLLSVADMMMVMQDGKMVAMAETEKILPMYLQQQTKQQQGGAGTPGGMPAGMMMPAGGMPGGMPAQMMGQLAQMMGGGAPQAMAPQQPPQAGARPAQATTQQTAQPSPAPGKPSFGHISLR
ncbi:MAG: type I secretion system permease/ATPase [Hydrotalea sp.]|nr:type I secretion system permease/ATPase [Hydrotalea sp.]